MKQVNLENVQEFSDSTRLPAGAYICVIRNVKDVAEKEYLKVTYDIAEGEYKGYYDSFRENHPDWEWIGSYTKSYKEKALPMFKRFCSAVSKSNSQYVFDAGAVNSDETTLIGKKVGLVLREEEYYKNNGDVGTRLYVEREFPIAEIAKQKVPPLKEIAAKNFPHVQPAKDANDFVAIAKGTAEEIPF